jgi:hypothetical protein
MNFSPARSFIVLLLETIISLLQASGCANLSLPQPHRPRASVEGELLNTHVGASPAKAILNV